MDKGSQGKWRKGWCFVQKLEVILQASFHIRYWPNSFHAHRLIQYAHDCHFKNIRLLVLSIFRGIYEEGKNISSIDTLAQIAESNGLSGARKVLSSTDYATSVIEEDDYAKDDLEIQY